VVEFQPAPQRLRQGLRRGIGNALVRLEQLENAFAPGHGALQNREFLGNILDRRIEHAYQVYEGYQGSERQEAFVVQACAVPQDDGGGRGREEFDERPERCHDVHLAQVGLHELGVAAVEARRDEALAAEQLYDGDSGYMLRYEGIHLGQPGALPAESVARHPPRDARGGKHRRK